jgi:membrane protease subunit HflC
MKNVGTIAAAVVIAIVLLAYMCTFQVRFTEVAIKKTWGKPAAEPIAEPGLFFKWPRPIQSVVVYDKRKRILEDRTEETRTVDGKNLLLTTFAVWRIKDPSKFHTNFPAGVEDGESKLRTTVVTHKHAVVGKHDFGEFVSTDSTQRNIKGVEEELLTVIARDALHDYGIEVVDFGIKKLGLPQSVTSAIFASMKAHEQRKGQRYAAEGEARAQDIVANANAIRERIMAAARQKVAEIRRDAQVVVSGYYKEFAEYPELRMYLDELRSVRDALQSRTTLVLETTEAPWHVFNKEAREKVGQESTSDAAGRLGGGSSAPGGGAD